MYLYLRSIVKLIKAAIPNNVENEHLIKYVFLIDSEIQNIYYFFYIFTVVFII